MIKNPAALITGLATILGAVGFSTDTANNVRMVIAAAVSLMVAVHSLVQYLGHKVTTTKAAEVQVAKASATAAVAAARPATAAVAAARPATLAVNRVPVVSVPPTVPPATLPGSAVISADA